MKTESVQKLHITNNDPNVWPTPDTDRKMMRQTAMI